jgi:hypothetical protein
MGAQVSSLVVEYCSYLWMNCSRKEIFKYYVSKKWAPYMISKLIRWCSQSLPLCFEYLEFKVWKDNLSWISCKLCCRIRPLEKWLEKEWKQKRDLQLIACVERFPSFLSCFFLIFASFSPGKQLYFWDLRDDHPCQLTLGLRPVYTFNFCCDFLLLTDVNE